MVEISLRVQKIYKTKIFGGRNCRPTATARRAVWAGTLRPEKQGHTTSSNGGTKRSEVGLGNMGA